MTLKTPIGMQADISDDPIPYSALDIRAIFEAMVQGEGVAGSASLKASQRGAGPNMSVDIAPGFAFIEGDDVALQGTYLAQNTAAYNVTIPAAPVSGSRTHRVIARIKDKLHNGAWSTYEWTLECLPDVGSGTPALPDSAISLALVTVDAGDSSVVNGNKLADARTNAFLLQALPLYKSKPLDGTGITNNSSSLVVDSDLTVTLAAATEYELDLTLIYSAHSSGDIKFGFDYPAGGGINLVCQGAPSYESGTAGDTNHLTINATQTMVFGGATTNNSDLLGGRISGHVYSGPNGGTFAFKACQASSHATATIVRAWSAMTLTPRT